MTSSQASIGNDDVHLATRMGTRMGTRMAARMAGDSKATTLSAPKAPKPSVKKVEGIVKVVRSLVKKRSLFESSQSCSQPPKKKPIKEESSSSSSSSDSSDESSSGDNSSDHDKKPNGKDYQAQSKISKLPQMLKIDSLGFLSQFNHLSSVMVMDNSLSIVPQLARLFACPTAPSACSLLKSSSISQSCRRALARLAGLEAAWIECDQAVAANILDLSSAIVSTLIILINKYCYCSSYV